MHYGFSAVFSMYSKEKLLGGGAPYELRCLQITSSAMKNSASIVLERSATVPYGGKLYLLLFKDDRIEMACDRPQAERIAVTNIGMPQKLPPRYAVDERGLWLRSITSASGTSYQLLAPSEYPDLIIELMIKSLIPKTADYIAKHYCHLSIYQNEINYSFNNEELFNFRL